MSRMHPQLRIRLPPEIKLWIEEAAARDRRSQNAFIVWCLDQIRDQTTGQPGKAEPVA